jgi:hypothetical protein
MRLGSLRWRVADPAVHFVGFRGEEWWSAIKVWGRPHFIHIGWDQRAQRDILPGDTVIFAQGDWDQPVSRFNFPDLKPGPFYQFA